MTQIIQIKVGTDFISMTNICQHIVEYEQRFNLKSLFFFITIEPKIPYDSTMSKNEFCVQSSYDDKNTRNLFSDLFTFTKHIKVKLTLYSSFT